MSEKVRTNSGSTTEDAARKDEKQVKLLVFEDGLIRLGDTELPGVLTELRVDGKTVLREKRRPRRGLRILTSWSPCSC